MTPPLVSTSLAIALYILAVYRASCRWPIVFDEALKLEPACMMRVQRRYVLDHAGKKDITSPPSQCEEYGGGQGREGCEEIKICLQQGVPWSGSYE